MTDDKISVRGTDYSKMSSKLFAEILWKIFLLNTIKTIILVNIIKIPHKLKSIIQNIFLNEDVNYWELVNNTVQQPVQSTKKPVKERYSVGLINNGLFIVTGQELHAYSLKWKESNRGLIALRRTYRNGIQTVLEFDVLMTHEPFIYIFCFDDVHVCIFLVLFVFRHQNKVHNQRRKT